MLSTAVTSILRGVSSIDDSRLKVATETMQYRMTRRLLVTSLILGFFDGLIESAPTPYFLEVVELPRAMVVLTNMVADIIGVASAYVMTSGLEMLRVSFCMQLAAIFFLVPKSATAVVITACYVVIVTTHVISRRAIVRLQSVYAPQCVPYRRIVPIAEVGFRCTMARKKRGAPAKRSSRALLSLLEWRGACS